MLSRFERMTNYAVLTVCAVTVLVPVVLLVFLAMGPTYGGGIVEFSSLHLGNFVRAWNDGDLGTGLLNSAIYSVCTVMATALLAIPAGYAFGTMRMRGGQVLFVVLLVGMMVPVTAVIVPMYYDFLSWHLLGNYGGLVAANTALSVSFGVFWMRSFFRTVPSPVLESATVDGATRWGTLWRVCVPMGRPAVTVMGLLVFMWTWNGYLLPLVLVPSSAMQPGALMLGNFQQRYGTEYSLMAAGAVILALPIVVGYVVFQRRLIAGILSGAVKG